MIYEVDPDPSDECAGIDLPGVSKVVSWPRRAADGPESRLEDVERASVLYRLAIVALALSAAQIVFVTGSERVARCMSCGEESPAGSGFRHRPNCLSAEIVRLIERLRELERVNPRGREDADTREQESARAENPSRSTLTRAQELEE